MKKTLTLVVGLVLALTTAQAQRSVYLSTNGKAINFGSIGQQTQKISLSRILMAGYNTICLPFDVEAEELRATVGEGVALEKLAKAEGNILYFLDVTEEGMEAGVPYIIYSPTRKVATFTTDQTTMTEPQRLTVDGASMYSSFQKETPINVYGIPAMQDTDVLQSILIRVDGEKSFLPTRCAISTDSENPEIRHITSLAEATGLNVVTLGDEKVDVYSVNGTLVKAGISMTQAQNALPKGMYVVKGQKFMVK